MVVLWGVVNDDRMFIF